MVADTPTMTIYERLSNVQEQLKAPKSKKATAGAATYTYRSCEDILEAAKPILKANGLVLAISDQIIQMESRHDIRPIELTDRYNKPFTEIHGGDRFYVEATATIYDFRGGSITSTASARETQVKRSMDDSQITGSASSYARKYALSGLFGIDDTKDADTDEYRTQTEQPHVSTNGTTTQSPRPASLYRFSEDDKQTLLDTIAGATTDSEWGDLTRFMLSKQDARLREAGVCLLMAQAPSLEILRRINNYLAKPDVKGRTTHTDAAFEKRQNNLNLPIQPTQSGIA